MLVLCCLVTLTSSKKMSEYEYEEYGYDNESEENYYYAEDTQPKWQLIPPDSRFAPLVSGYFSWPRNENSLVTKGSGFHTLRVSPSDKKIEFLASNDRVG